MRVVSRPLLVALGLVSLLGFAGCAEREKPTEQQSVAPAAPPPVIQNQPVTIPQGIPIKRPMAGAMVDPNAPAVEPTVVVPQKAVAAAPSASASASK